MHYEGVESARFASFARLIKLQYALAVTLMLMKMFVTYGTAPWILSVGWQGLLAALCFGRGMSWALMPNVHLPEDKAAAALQKSAKLVVVAGLVMAAGDIVLYMYCSPAQRKFMIVLMLMACACQLFYFTYMPRAAMTTATAFGASTVVLVVLDGDLTDLATLVTIGSILGVMSHAVYAHHQSFSALLAAHAKLKQLGAVNERLASTDALTGLPNRREFFKAKAEAHRQFLETGQPFAVGIADLDGFKAANDTYGHSVGDDVLVTAASRMEMIAAGKAKVYRLGGDEFAFITTSPMQSEQASLLGEAMIGSVSAPMSCNGATVSVGCSVGIALYPNATTDIGKMLEAADEALYVSKHRGRGRVTVNAGSEAQSAEPVRLAG